MLQVRGAHAEQRARLRLLRHLVEPVAVREAQEAGEAVADGALEAADAVGVGNVQVLQRLGQPVAEHQQRRLLEMRDQEQQEMLVAELRQHAALGAVVEGRARVAHHHQRMAAAQVARVRRGAGVGPEAVVAVALLEVGQLRLGKGQQRRRCRPRARAGEQAQAHEVAARQRARLVQRQVGHDRHAVVLDLAEAQGAGPARMVADQRLAA